MRFTITILERDYAALIAHLFPDQAEELEERAAYLLCGRSDSGKEHRLLVREVHPVSAEEVLSATATHVSISSSVYVKWLKRAAQTGQSLLLVHSHPNRSERFSAQDDAEEKAFFSTAYIRAPEGFHGSVVIASKKNVSARIWLPDGTTERVALLRVVGRQLRFLQLVEQQYREQLFYDRQVRAFGPDLQKLLHFLHVGIVGAGGIGSNVIEELVRLGVGEISVWDPDVFSPTNVNRVYGSTINDAWTQKVEVVARETRRKGLSTKLNCFSSNIGRAAAAKALRNCDVVFGCTDDHYGRSILNRLSLWYYIPVFDTAVEVDSRDGVIRSVIGRVTTLLPGDACLRCRKRISQDIIDAEAIAMSDRREYDRLRRQGYVAELGDIAPAVIMFTTAIAALAVTELVDRLTQFSGVPRPSELLYLFHDTEIRRNNRQSSPDCFCSSRRFWGRGDESRFLGVTWPDQ